MSQISSILKTIFIAFVLYTYTNKSELTNKHLRRRTYLHDHDTYIFLLRCHMMPLLTSKSLKVFGSTLYIVKGYESTYRSSGSFLVHNLKKDIVLRSSYVLFKDIKDMNCVELYPCSDKRKDDRVMEKVTCLYISMFRFWHM